MAICWKKKIISKASQIQMTIFVVVERVTNFWTAIVLLILPNSKYNSKYFYWKNKLISNASQIQMTIFVVKERVTNFWTALVFLILPNSKHNLCFYYSPIYWKYLGKYVFSYVYICTNFNRTWSCEYPILRYLGAYTSTIK